GSGFIISADGYVLTDAHVVDAADEITVRLNDKREFKARVIGADRRTDLALIRIDATGLPAVRMGDPNRLKVGEWVVAIGSPFGFDSTVTAGIVSAKGRSLPQENFVPFIQTDVAINQGIKANVEPWRNGVTREPTVTVGELPEDRVASRSERRGKPPEQAANRLGFAVVDLTAEQKRDLKLGGGVIVEEVRNNRRADV